jgi:hypothetical protein
VVACLISLCVASCPRGFRIAEPRMVLGWNSLVMNWSSSERMLKTEPMSKNGAKLTGPIIGMRYSALKSTCVSPPITVAVFVIAGKV